VEEDYLSGTLGVADPILVPTAEPNRILGAGTWRRALQPNSTYLVESRAFSAAHVSSLTPLPMPSLELARNSIMERGQDRGEGILADISRSLGSRDSGLLPGEGVGRSMKIRSRPPVNRARRQSKSDLVM
jgi:hypothetical protein